MNRTKAKQGIAPQKQTKLTEIEWPQMAQLAQMGRPGGGIGGRSASVRLGPLGTAWDRIKFFPRTRKRSSGSVGKCARETGTRSSVNPKPYAAIRGFPASLRGNTRTVRRQYAAKELASVRPACGTGYCRVTGPSKFETRNSECGVGAWMRGYTTCCGFFRTRTMPEYAARNRARGARLAARGRVNAECVRCR